MDAWNPVRATNPELRSLPHPPTRIPFRMRLTRLPYPWRSASPPRSCHEARLTLMNRHWQRLITTSHLRAARVQCPRRPRAGQRTQGPTRLSERRRRTTRSDALNFVSHLELRQFRAPSGFRSSPSALMKEQCVNAPLPIPSTSLFAASTPRRARVSPGTPPRVQLSRYLPLSHHRLSISTVHH